MRVFLNIITVIILLSRCSGSNSENDVKYDEYFGGLTVPEIDDSSIKIHLARVIKELDEPFLIGPVQASPTYRLTVVPSFASPYCIKISKEPKGVIVLYKDLLEKKKTEIGSSIDNLLTTYQSRGPDIDSLFVEFTKSLNRTGIRNATNLYDISGAADGTYYLFEMVENGRHIVLFRVFVGQTSFKRVYGDADEFLNVVTSLKNFVPECILQHGRPSNAAD